jgi:hypothetical protein
MNFCTSPPQEFNKTYSRKSAEIKLKIGVVLPTWQNVISILLELPFGRTGGG